MKGFGCRDVWYLISTFACSTNFAWLIPNVAGVRLQWSNSSNAKRMQKEKSTLFKQVQFTVEGSLKWSEAERYQPHNKYLYEIQWFMIVDCPYFIAACCHCVLEHSLPFCVCVEDWRDLLCSDWKNIEFNTVESTKISRITGSETKWKRWEWLTLLFDETRKWFLVLPKLLN